MMRTNAFKKFASAAAVAAVSAAAIFFGCGNDDNPTGNGDHTVTYGTFTDSRDNQTYRYVTIGTQVWMADNLNFETASGSWCYDDQTSNCDIYGRLYDWATAMNIGASYNNTLWDGGDVGRRGVCPAGWRLPSGDEWQTLIDFVGGSSIAGTKLKSETGWFEDEWSVTGTNDFGFSALPGGRRNSDGDFLNAGMDGYWWTATQHDATYARRRDMNYDNEYVYSRWDVKTYGRSVRCIRGDGDNGGTENILTVNSQVYYNNSRFVDGAVIEEYTPFSGFAASIIAKYWDPNDTLVDVNVNGNVVNGQIVFTVDAPELLLNAGEYLEAFFHTHDDVDVSDPDANFAMLDYFVPNDNGGTQFWRLKYVVMHRTDNQVTLTQERVTYLYFDRDVTVSGRGKTDTNAYEEDGTVITDDIVLEFKEGWNAFHTKWDMTYTFGNGGVTSVWTEENFIADPSDVRWIAMGQTFDWDATPSLLPETAATLTDGEWSDSLFDGRVEHWYSFFAEEGTTYHLWFNDYWGINDKTGGISIDGWYEDGTRAFDIVNDGYFELSQFTATHSGTVYLRAYPAYALGTYGVAFSTSDTRPGSSERVGMLPLRRVSNGNLINKETIIRGIFRSRRVGAR